MFYKLVGWLCWGLTSQSTIFQSCRDGAIASWVINQYFRGVKCLAQGHNTAAVGLEPRTSRSGVRHSTTEPPRSPCFTSRTNYQCRLCWSDCADAQAELHLCCSHMAKKQVYVAHMEAGQNTSINSKQKNEKSKSLTLFTFSSPCSCRDTRLLISFIRSMLWDLEETTFINWHCYFE